jgi:hypothetical protein
MRESGSPSILRLEILLAGTANGTNPIIRKGLESGSGGDPAIRISLSRIVDITADSTNVFLHFPALFSVGMSHPAHNSICVFFFKGGGKKAVPGTLAREQP